MVKKCSRSAPSEGTQSSSPLPITSNTVIANPMLYNINPLVPFTAQQNMDIIMKEQYITFINEDNALRCTTKNSFINAKLCLNNALLPDEHVEEIELSIVAGKETKIHGMLLHITPDINESNNNAKKVFYCILLLHLN